MSDSNPPIPNETGHQKAASDKDSWLLDHYELTDKDKEAWEAAGFPPHFDIVGGFLTSNNLVFGVPGKMELFRLDQRTREETSVFGGPEWSHEDTLRLWYVGPSPLPFVYYTLALPPGGMGLTDVVEVNYNVRLQALVRRMWLQNVRVLHGSESDDSPKVVFEGTEYPSAAANRKIRIVRITVHAPGAATWETVAESTYPRSPF